METAEILSSASNHAIVRTPGRKFPGSVIQGDSLKILFDLACDVEDRVASSNDEELRDTASELRDLLEARLRHYDEVLQQHGLERPYTSPQWRDS